jgi:hypothetical protein
MKASRRVAAVLGGLALAGAVTTGPALAATTNAHSVSSSLSVLAPSTDPSQGFCNQDEDGQLKLGGDGHLYQCRYIWGLGWYWMPY